MNGMIKAIDIRKSFGKLDQMPKILIVTEKLLTGFDAPVLYAMYLDSRCATTPCCRPSPG